MIEYDAHHWRSHLLDVKGSMVREITGRVLACVVWSAVVATVHHFVQPVETSPTIHSLVGLALGLLLVFRTNASYDRYWEGRKLWGGIVNECRNLARSGRSLLKADPRLYDELMAWTVAFPYAAMHRLRDERGLGPLADRLPPSEAASALACPNLPLAIAARMTEVLVRARDRGLISDYALGLLDQNVQLLIDYLGGCERIHRTPLPFVYVVHLRRALIIYCFTLPFALVREFGWVTIFDTLIVAYVFFGIEEIGVEIEDPFGRDVNDLPLEEICGRIASDLDALPPTAEADGPAAIREAS